MSKISVIGLVLLFAGLANAQAPTSGNVFFGYSYYNADIFSQGRSSLNGWNASLEGRIFPHVGLVADFSEAFGSQNVTIQCPGPNCPVVENINAHEYNMLFGPRVSLSVGKIRPFGEALFGVGHVGTNGAGSDTSFATALGGGIDYRIIRPVAVRFELDYLQTRLFGPTQNGVRFSTGIVVRF
jgi:opacity protein-like surface antigen